MKYEKVVCGKFLSRPNRFVAEVEIQGKKTRAHVKNTGRCKELLVPGVTIYLEDFRHRMGNRKMEYSLIGVEKGKLMINMDSQAPNKVVKEALEDGRITLEGMKNLTQILPEKTYGNSRLDFYVEDEEGEKGFIEVKGVTLEEGGKALFPDAPTTRGIKHIKELQSAFEDSYHAYIIFVVQMKGIHSFSPNDRTHKEFGETLRESKGVKVLVYDCQVGKDSLEIREKINF